eukprot:6490419-Amphidinium_carterae.10
MASASSNTPLDSHMFDDPSAEHAERYAVNTAPAPGLNLRSEQVMSPNQREQQLMRERSRSHVANAPRRSATRTLGTPTSHPAEDQFHYLP